MRRRRGIGEPWGWRRLPRKSGGVDGSDEIVDGVVARSAVEADVIEVVDEVGVDAGVGCGEGSEDVAAIFGR